MQRRSRPYWLIIAIPPVVVVTDQLAKAVISRWIGHGRLTHAWWLFGDWLGFAYTENRGVAFGLMSGVSIAALLVAAAAILIALAGFLYLWRGNLLVGIGGGLVIGGALGNILDRARLGYVRDFVAVGPWPSFNVADSAITCGAIIIAIGVTFGELQGKVHPQPEDGMQSRVMEVIER